MELVRQRMTHVALASADGAVKFLRLYDYIRGRIVTSSCASVQIRCNGLESDMNRRSKIAINEERMWAQSDAVDSPLAQ